ncbi:MAG: hypothetical protein GX201_11850 [Clostridiales bacterium]|nr:hypothetical protein [Clostridiales bacterium]
MEYFTDSCVLYNRHCIKCGECNDICDLNINKICDNCCKCIEVHADYYGIDIDDILIEEEWEAVGEIEDLYSNWKYEVPYTLDINEE